MNSSLKSKTYSGIIWSSIDRFSAQGIQFIIGLIIARILSPSDYGLIGMIAVFTGLAANFVDSGFSNALIRNNKRSEADYNTMFYFNLAVALLFYFILFFSAPFISRFYNQPELIPIIKVISLNLIINAFTLVQRTRFSAAVNFKSQALVSIVSVVVGGSIGIFLAYNGYGVWSLVGQMLSLNITTSFIFWLVGKWKPKFIFSFQSLKEMFGYGSKLLGAGIIDTLYNNLYYLTIGKFFNTNSLGYYTRARGFADFPSTNLTGIFQRVTFPVLSEIQDDEYRLKDAYKRILRMAAFVIFPLMLILAIVAKPMILLLLTDKWADAIILLQILCLAQMWYPIHAINLNMLYVKGRSDLFLKLEIIKKVLLTIVLAATIPFGVIAIAMGQVLFSLLALVINTYYSGKLIGYNVLSQLSDLFGIFLITIISAAAAFLIMFVTGNLVLQIIISILTYILIYYSMANFFHIKEADDVNKIMKKLIRK